MPRAAAVIDVTTPSGSVRVVLPASDPDGAPTGPGLARLVPTVDAPGEPTSDWAPVVPIRRSA